MKRPAYFLFEVLPDELKVLHKIKSQSRYDLISVYNPDEYLGLEPFKKANGQTALYLIPARELVSVDSRRQAEWALTDGKLNLSSLYFEDVQSPGFAYGYANPRQYLSNGHANPMFEYRSDGYLFITNKESTRIEMLVYPNGRNLITALYYNLLDGALDGTLKEHREKSNHGTFDYGMNELLIKG